MRGSNRLGRTNLLSLVLLVGLAAGVWSSAASVSAQGGLPTRPAVHTIATLHQGLRVYWYEPGEDGGSAITGYDVEYRSVGSEQWTDAGHTGTSQPALITGLRFNTSYEVRVRARNANGAGSWSSVESRRTSRDDGKPDRPWPPTLEPGDGRIEVSWTAPAYTGGRPITGYHVRYTTDNAATWRTWAPGGNRLISGTTTTITGLANGVTVGVAVGAINARGQGLYSLPFSEAAPALKLTLSLESSRQLCTANTLTELSWTIAGGAPPYTLTIEGQKVDAGTAAHRLNCGTLQINPQTEEPLPNQKKTFSAAVSDSRSASAMADASVVVRSALPAAVDLKTHGEFQSVRVYWSEAADPTTLTERPIDYLIRWRLASAKHWGYEFAGPSPWSRTSGEWAWAHSEDISNSSLYQLAVAGIRDALEQETPDALQWTETDSFRTVGEFSDVEVTSTHSTITVSWASQGDRWYWVQASNPQGSQFATRFSERGGRTEALITRLRPDTDYNLHVHIRLGGSPTFGFSRTVRTKPAPPGWRTPTTGPTNLQVDQTAQNISATWDPPYEGATMLYRVELTDPETGRRIGPPQVIDETRFTYQGLIPSTRYDLEVVHLGTVIRSAKQSVTTKALTQSVAGAGQSSVASLPPFAARTPSFSWPIMPGATNPMTADPWIWRGPDLGTRYHVGLDIGTSAGTPVYAAASGVLRVVNDDLSEPRYLLYCPDRSPLAQRKSFHEQIDYSGDSYKVTAGRLACMYIVSPASGRTALIFHDDGLHVTKYSHLAGFSDRISKVISGNPRATLRVAAGEMIARSGSSADHSEMGTPEHLHFEIRYLYGSVFSHWYVNSQAFAVCDPRDLFFSEVLNDDAKTVTRAYCGWHLARNMDTVRDPEAFFPPLPAEAASAPGSRAVELTGVAPTSFANKPAVKVDLSVSIARPLFYNYSDYEWVPARSSGLARTTMPGLARSRPNVTGFRVWPDGECKLPTGTGLLDELDLLNRDIVRTNVSVTIPLGSTCTLAVASRNEQHGLGFPGVTQRGSVSGFPEHVTPRNAQLKTYQLSNLTDPHSATLANFDVHIYYFTVQNGSEIDISVTTSTIADVVLKLREPDGKMREVDDVERGTERMRFAARTSGAHVVLVRGGYLAGDSVPSAGTYALHHSVSCPSTRPGGVRGQQAKGSAGSAPQQCPAPRLDPPTKLTISRVTGTTAKLSWESGDAATTGYRLALDGTPLRPQPDLGGLTSHTFRGLSTATTEHVFSVVATGDLILESEPAALTLLLPPGSPGATATDDSITLSWNEVGRAERYELKRLAGDVACAGEGVQATVNDDGSAQTFSHAFTTGVEASKRYTLCVRAANAQGPSAWVATAVTTQASQCPSPRPLKPAASGYRPLATATTWAQPSGGKTAELESEERQPQTRSVTWNAAECRWDEGRWADVGDSYWTTPAPTGVTRPAPAKPAASGYRPLGTATTWAQPAGGKTAELESEERQPQTRSVTWNTVECRWDAGKWADVGDTYWTTPAATGVTRPAPAKPAANGYRPLATATTWAQPSGGKTAELESEERQPQTRSVTWNAAERRWDEGKWADVGDSYWTTPAPTGDTRTAPAKPAANGYRTLATATTWGQPAGGKTAELESEERQPQTRSVTWNAAECQWDAGEWGDVGDSYWTTPSPTGETRPAPAKPIERQLRDRKTEGRSEVRGTTAHKQSRQVATEHRRTVSWDESQCRWDPGDWDDGVPWSTPWKDTGEEIERPPTRTWTTRVNEARTGRTRVSRVQSTPICLEQTQEQLRYRIRYSAQAYVWDGDMSWVPGTVTSTTPPVWHTRWRDVGSQRLCRIGGQDDEAAAADAGPSFEAGQHTLQWGTVWLRFTVPAGSSVLLTARADATRELTAVFSLAGGAELIVSPSALARDERPTSTDPTLASLATSLALVEEPLVASAQSGDTACATATPGAPSAATRVDLDASDCTLISGGGSVVLVAGKASRTLTLPEGREWIAFAAPVAQGNGSDAFWLIDAASGSLIVLDPGSGNELARQLTDGSAELKGLLDGIAASADD